MNNPIQANRRKFTTHEEGAGTPMLIAVGPDGPSPFSTPTSVETAGGIVDAILENELHRRALEEMNDSNEGDDTPLKEYTFSYDSYSSFEVANFTIQEYLKSISSDEIVIKNEITVEFEFDVDKSKPVLVKGAKVYNIKGQILVCVPSIDSSSTTISGNHDFTDLVDKIKDYVKWNNPLRRKNIQIIETNRGFKAIFKPIPHTTFESVILDKEMKADIYDQTIFQLKEIDGNNGIILYGQPGTGKSATCQAIVNEAIKVGFSTCFLADDVHYTTLNTFIEQFISPCVLFLEDVDSFAQNREEMGGKSEISSFLNFINGIGEKKEKIVFVATTNYLDRLDKAVSNRPMRFNRKFKFNLPTDDEVKQLLDLYFAGIELSEKQIKSCCDKSYTGSHFKEILRTATLLSKKFNKAILEVFDDAVQSVGKNFSPTIKKAVGFGSSNNESTNDE